ncbi:hypothetical protein E1295_01535 [Nonomuraea mesophila]|uniref:PPE domain-containing protein n=1 Tax=Nonomuraea mesophila TaxID=2530382 RepID=A0A4R5FXD8_9ACTN|nr:hypothetical protein [Nonomuraea mesophila]TDE59959.1 hypothetical protein E1295_01535 [Nonomuraea mesophila]
MPEPETTTTQLHLNDARLDTSTPDASWMKSTIASTGLMDSTIDEVKRHIDETDPGSVKLAGLYYEAAEPLLNSFATDLKTKAADLAEYYKGPSAYQTQLQLQGLAASARELATKLGAMGRSLKGYGETLQWAQANVVESAYRDSRSDRDIDYAAALNPFNGPHRGDERAADHMKAVNERIVGHYEQLPSEVQQALPIVVNPEMPDFRRDPLQTGGPPWGDHRSVGGYDPDSFGPGSVKGVPAVAGPHDGAYPGGDYPGGGRPGVGDPPGSDTSVGNVPSSPSGTPGGVNPPGGPHDPGSVAASGVPTATTPNPGGTDLAGYDPSTGNTTPGGTQTTTGGPGTGTGTGVPGGGSAGNGGAAAAGAGRTGAGGMGFPMMPMMGGGAGGRDQENDRESSTWLAEDDDVWGGPEGTTQSTIA